jgi:8-oxo-dGTP diphosphatase
MPTQKTSHDSESPTPGQQVITAGALIHHRFDGATKIFLPKRADTKKFLPGIYELPGGHIDFGEDIVDGLKREIVEELGVRIAVGDPISAFTYMNGVKGSHSIEVLYFATLVDPPDKIRINPADHSGFMWVGRDELGCVEPMTDIERSSAMKGFALLHGSPPSFA